MIKTLTKRRALKFIALFMASNLLLEILVPTAAYALTNGPSQPEIQSFEPIGTSEMVSLFSGDFTYNIPLFELPGPNGGYPFNLAYHSGVGMDQEASWTGLGWNLQPGSMTRSMSGMPDEFNGDAILRKMDIKEDKTLGIRAGAGVELFGWEKDSKGKKKYDSDAPFSLTLNASLGIYNNSYKGLSTEIGFGASPNLSHELLKKQGSKSSIGLTSGLNTQFTLNSQDGVDVGATASAGLDFRADNKNGKRYGFNQSIDIGFNYNHKQGMEAITFGTRTGISLEQEIMQKSYVSEMIDKKIVITEKLSHAGWYPRGSLYTSATFTLAKANSGYTPQVSMPFKTNTFAANAKLGGAIGGVYVSGNAAVSFSRQHLKDANKWTASPAFGYLHLDGANEVDNGLLDFNREKDGIIRSESTNLWMPRLTHDSYSITGHGLMGSYRPYRRDIGAVWDPVVRSESSGYTAGVEVGLGQSIHVGGNYGDSQGHSQNNKMEFINEHYKFQKNENNNQMVYFKGHGESTTKPLGVWDNIGNYEPMRFRKNVSNKYNYEFDNLLEGNVGVSNKNMGTNNTLMNSEKERRNSIVLPITNKDLLEKSEAGGALRKGVLKEFNIQYYDHTNSANKDDFTSATVVKTYDRHPKHISAVTDAEEINATLSNTDDVDNDPNTTTWLEEHNKINKSHHIAGFLNVDPSGLRYVYGLPVYNTEQVDANFSALKTGDLADVIDLEFKGGNKANGIDYKSDAKGFDKTDKYFSKSKTPPYAYAYMLTSILGVDYVDADDIDGPSDGDLGYWVKFNYRKVSDDYKWRAPFNGAKYNPGVHNTKQDDRGSYAYGQKEIWYLATAETSTHKAYFHIDERQDAKGAEGELQNAVSNWTNTASSYQLQRIRVVSKAEPDKPIKEVHFTYNNTLCDGILNNAQGNGKLTLEKVHFEYRGNKMGKNMPYVFDYGKVARENGPIVNPNYSPYNVDRWGNYRDISEIPGVEVTTDAEKWQFQLDFPYVFQGDEAYRQKLDDEAHAWTLTDIKLPSGAALKVEYEADDYAYVQNKQAMYMTDIVGLSTPHPANPLGKNEAFPELPANDEDPDLLNLYSEGTKEERTRIYFKLKNKVAYETSSTKQLNELLKYIDQVSWQLYFKTKIHLQTEDKDHLQEFVAGYAEIEKIHAGNIDVVGGLVGKEEIGNTGDYEYTHGFITVKKVAKGKKWHPISVAAWQHIQVNQPELYAASSSLPASNAPAKTIVGDALGMVGSMSEYVGQMTKGFYKWAGRRKQWGRQLVEGKSWIRMNVPDKVKVGGGSRVKKVSISDGWSYGGVKPATYGQVYKYTTTDSDGNEYSSGVAAYEPLLGGDEISVRTARHFSAGVPLRNDNDFFFEFPINESFYPGPSVGYSKVTVMSLASAKAKNYTRDANGEVVKDADGNALKSLGFHSTTGATVHEYYTAKDFPVITSETEKNGKWGKAKTKYKVVLNESFQNSIATQGYTVILNNMHGQTKKVSSYEMDDMGNIKPEPLSYTEYKFKSKAAEAHGLPAQQLDNVVLTLESDKDGESPVTVNRIIGEEMDFFVDARETEMYNRTHSEAANLDFSVFPPIPISVALPNTQKSLVRTRSISTNKIISRIGILEEVTAWTMGAKVKTQNEVWDALTGEVVLKSVDNNFNDKIYSYSIPAHLKYEGLGPAYINTGMRIKGIAFEKLITKRDEYAADGVNHETKPSYYTVSMNQVVVPLSDFYLGDEFIVNDVDGYPIGTMIYTGIEKNEAKEDALGFYSKLSFEELSGDLSLFLYRSGRRNLLGAKVGSLTAKKNPLDPANRTLLNNQKLPAIDIPNCPTGDCSNRDGE